MKLAQRHGLYRTAKALHLDYTRLKAFVNGDSGRKPKDAPAFVELLTADRGPECVVELENARGKTMRIHLRGFAAPDLVVLSRIFWSSRG